MNSLILVRIGSAVGAAILGLSLVLHLLQDPVVFFLLVGVAICIGVYWLTEKQENSGS